MTAANDGVLVLGILVLALDAASVIRLLIVPRAAASVLALPTRWVRSVFRGLSQLARSYPGKDRILSISEPVALMVLLGTWLVTAVLGYGLVIWGLGGAGWSQAFLEAGSSVSTLGFAHGGSGGYQAVDFFAGATGMVLVALQIAYLPTIYSAYNRRETFVTLLESRAGAPAWGPEILLRHQLVGTIGNLPALYADWERWAADVAESHTSYQSLMYLRSPRPQNSWVISLVAVMDSAAIALAVDPDGAPIEARMCLRMGFTCLRDIARVVNIPFDPDPNPDDPIQLPQEQFEAAYAHLRENGYLTPRPMDEAWNHFRGWRVNYEGVAYGLATKLDAPPARWTGPRRTFRGELLSPVRPVDRQPGGAPPKIFFPRLSSGSSASPPGGTAPSRGR